MNRNRIATVLLALFCVAPMAHAGTITGTPGKLVTPVGQDSTGAWNVLATDSGGNLLTAAGDGDFFLEVAKGNITGTSIFLVRGHNPTQTAVSGFLDVAESGDLTYLTTSETMNIVSTSTSDDGAPAGIGAQTVQINGIANDGSALSETVTLNGTTNVLTTGSYLRVNLMTVLAVGTSGWNVGVITAKASSAATVQATMNATEALSQDAHFTVPLGKTGYVYRIELNTSKLTGGTAPIVEFAARARKGGAGNAWLQLFDKRLDTLTTNELDVDLPFPAKLIARTDIRMTADVDQNSTETRTRTYFLLVDD